eukprot:scaffold3319_cov427-Prasinococcus_capsulatus_cf.AAC.27
MYDALFCGISGFLVLKGWGWRKERKGSPLRNIFRQYCDARNVVCVTILQAPDGADTVEVDTSTLRLCGVEEAQIREEIARTMGTVAVVRAVLHAYPPQLGIALVEEVLNPVLGLYRTQIVTRQPTRKNCPKKQFKFFPSGKLSESSRKSTERDHCEVLVYEASDRNEAYELVKTLSTDLKLARSVGSVSKQHPVRDKKRQHRDQRQYEARDFRTDDVP